MRREHNGSFDGEVQEEGSAIRSTRKVAHGAIGVQEEESAKGARSGRAGRGRRGKAAGDKPNTSGQLKYNNVGSPIR